MNTALLLTGIALLYAALSRHPGAARSWPRTGGMALWGAGAAGTAASEGLGRGAASALVMSMATLSLLALTVPLSPRVGWSLITVSLAGIWLCVLGSCS